MILPLSYTSYGYRNNDLINAARSAITGAVTTGEDSICASFRPVNSGHHPKGFGGFVLCEAGKGYSLRVYVNPFDSYGKKSFKAVKVSIKETGRVREDTRRSDGSIYGSILKVNAEVEFDFAKIIAILNEAEAAYLDAKARTEKMQNQAQNAQLDLNAKVEAAIPGAQTSGTNNSGIGAISFRAYERNGKLYCCGVTLEISKYDAIPAEAVRRIAEIVRVSIDPIVAAGKAEFLEDRKAEALRSVA